MPVEVRVGPPVVIINQGKTFVVWLCEDRLDLQVRGREDDYAVTLTPVRGDPRPARGSPLAGTA